jgi:O-antigen/teichoic acid export membrane protein
VTAVPSALGPGDYGEWAVALSVVTITSATFALGGPATLTRFVPGAHPHERDAVARALATRLSRWRAAQVAAAALAGGVLALLAPDTFPPVVTAFVVAAIAVDVGATVAFQTALAFGRTGLWSFRFPLQNVLLACGAVLLYSAFGTAGAVAAIALASGAAMAVGAAAVLPRLLRAPGDGTIPAGALRFGALQAASSLLTQAKERGGVVAVAVLYGSRVESGFASLAIGAALAPVYAVRQAFAVQMPALAEQARDDLAGAEAAGHRLSRQLGPLLVALALLGALWLDDLLPLVIGEDFRGVGPALGPALAVLPLAGPLALAGQVAALRLQPEARLWATVWGTVAFAVVAAASVPWAGAVGATSALLAGTAATLAVFAVRLPGLMTRVDAASTSAAVALVVAVGAVS